jgi:PhoPQ-activated pathogenicity-related protein
MVKSAVLAMDTAQEFLQAPARVAASTSTSSSWPEPAKRGWTTWLTAAVDSRVAAAIPIVIDVLNVDTVHGPACRDVRLLGAQALYDYHYNHITEHIGTPELAFMLKNEDPYLFRKRLTMPKYIVNATRGSVLPARRLAELLE